MANKNYYQHRLLHEGTEYVDVETLSETLKLCTEQIRRLTRDGKIPAIKKGRRWWYDPIAVQFKRQSPANLFTLARSTGL